ncbi:hypothetical protein FKP32DRAFT_1598356 [Trametes sanguinea]|nr:hypothetical protein FKP32DRAFT_1598356 [Trametes sanguinea]
MAILLSGIHGSHLSRHRGLLSILSLRRAPRSCGLHPNCISSLMILRFLASARGNCLLLSVASVIAVSTSPTC